ALTRTGLPKLPSNPTISLLRGGQELRVDWPAISGRGMTYTNYQIMPGDRVRIAKRPVASDYAAPAAPKPSAEPDNTHYINIRELAIPFDVNPARIKSIDALTVRVSRDRGRTWERLPSPKPEDKRFTFSAPDDGEYWFGVSVPGDTASPIAGLKVVVDTKPPVVRLTASEENDIVWFEWTVSDDNLHL